MKLQEEMFALVAEWKNSGLTKKNFLADRGISLSKFNYWCSKYNADSEFKAVAIGDSRGDFQELTLRESGAGISEKIVELTTSTGLHIRIFG